MKIAVWRTGHEIADRVAEAVYEGLSKANDCIISLHSTSELSQSLIEGSAIHIAYGVLRGCTDVFRKAKECQKDYIELDRGYWKPDHFRGFYRISLNGTQQTLGLDKLEPDYERWDRLGIEILPTTDRSGLPLVCEPTSYVENFFGMQPQDWWLYQCYNNKDFDKTFINRPKGCERNLQSDLDRCSKVITFNSSVGWEALRQGIDVQSDPNHSIVGAYQKLVDFPLCSSYDERRRMFGIMASLQLTLAEISEGKLWPLINRLMSISAGTGVKQ